MVDTLISLKNVTKLYRNLSSDVYLLALRGVSLSIDKKPQLVSIVGPSGSGKSTLLNILAGKVRPTTGKVMVENIPIKQLNNAKLQQYKSSIGYVSQYPRDNLITSLTIYQNIKITMKSLSSNVDIESKIVQICKHLDLEDRMDHLPREISGGEAQRAALAVAISSDPKILIADEPTGELDEMTSKELIQYLMKLKEEFSMTIIVGTHDPLFEQYSDQVFLLEDGLIAKIDHRIHDEIHSYGYIDDFGCIKLPLDILNRHKLTGRIIIKEREHGRIEIIKGEINDA